MYKLSFFLITFFFTATYTRAQTTYYVDAARPDNSGAGTSWANAKRDLQVAINQAASGDLVWVKAGTYRPTHDAFASTTPADNRDKTFSLKNGVKVYGGFAGTETQLSQRNWKTNLVTLSGDLGTTGVATDNSYHVVISVNLNNATLLDGVIVTGGYATAPNLSSITVGGRLIERFKGGGVYNTHSATVFSNCTIRTNSADCTNTDNDAWGAGVVNENCTSVFSDCLISGNSFLVGGGSFGVFGAGMIILGGSCTLTNCAFINNTSGSGFFDGTRGGALYLNSTSTVITNCVFYNNSAQNGAAIGLGGVPNTPVVTNCTFAGNTSDFSGTAYSGFSKGVFRNCIFWNNTPTVNPVAGRNEILSMETNVANQPTFTNCIIRDATGSPATVLNAQLTNCITTNPGFVNLADGDGADNIILTADDGLRLSCGAAAVNAGTGSTPTVDVLNVPRTTPLDIGAYEGGQVSTAFNAIPSAQTTVQLFQPASGTSHYSDCSSQLLSIQSGGGYTIAGSVTAKVWIEGTQPSGYVKRHYEIMPQINAATVSGRVTLFFRQQEFNDFNAVAGHIVKLPTGPGDAAGIGNIRIEKRAGTSSNGTGLPNTYPGTIQTIPNASLSINWNAGASRWEISFDVTGFSGFFLKTQLSVLPLQLLSFTANPQGNCTQLNWQTTDEVNTKAFEVQVSSDGAQYTTIATQTATGTGSNTYNYADCPARSGVFYRLRMIDHDGAYTYSPVLRVGHAGNQQVNIYPNPAGRVLVLSSGNTRLLGSVAHITDASGRFVQQSVIDRLPYTMTIDKLSPGFYYLQLKDGTNLSFVKQ